MRACKEMETVFMVKISFFGKNFLIFELSFEPQINFNEKKEKRAIFYLKTFLLKFEYILFRRHQLTDNFLNLKIKTKDKKYLE